MYATTAFGTTAFVTTAFVTTALLRLFLFDCCFYLMLLLLFISHYYHNRTNTIVSCPYTHTHTHTFSIVISASLINALRNYGRRFDKSRKPSTRGQNLRIAQGRAKTSNVAGFTKGMMRYKISEEPPIVVLDSPVRMAVIVNTHSCRL
jgi:hypothetical protein